MRERCAEHPTPGPLSHGPLPGVIEVPAAAIEGEPSANAGSASCNRPVASRVARTDSLSATRPPSSSPSYGRRCDRRSYTIAITPRTVWHEGTEHGQQLRRFNRVGERAQIRPRHPRMCVQADLFIGEQAGPYERWSLVGEVRDEEVLRPDVPPTVPPHVPLDPHRPVQHRGRVEPGLLGQLASCRRQRRLAQLNTATGQLPEPCPVERITPAQKKQSMGGVQADDGLRAGVSLPSSSRYAALEMSIKTYCVDEHLKHDLRRSPHTPRTRPSH